MPELRKKIKNNIPFVSKKKYHGKKEQINSFENNLRAYREIKKIAETYWTYSQTEIKTLKAQNTALKWLTRQINQQKQSLEQIGEMLLTAYQDKDKEAIKLQEDLTNSTNNYLSELRELGEIVREMEELLAEKNAK